MMGLMMGMTIFSAMSMQWAKQELENIQKRQQAEATRSAEDMAGAMEFAMLAENKDTYGETPTLERARMFAATTGKTRGDQNFLATVREEQTEGRFGAPRSQVAITASDDTLLRSQMHRAADGEELNRAAGGEQPVALLDTSAVRDRQVRTSNMRMNSLAEQVYAFYAAKMKFPSTSEFTEMATKLGFRDVWGQSFEYTVSADQQSAQIGFTTPWDYTQSLKLNLKDDSNASSQ